jgi:competence protein ComEC
MQAGIAIAGSVWRAGTEAATARLNAWIAAEHGRFALWLPVFMAAGVVLYFSLPREPPAWAGAVAFLACLAAGRAAEGLPLPRAACWAAAAMALGLASAQLATALAPPVADIPRHGVVVTGTVRAVELLPRGRRVTLEQPRLDGAPPLARAVRLRLRAGDALVVGAGDTLQVRGLLMRPSSPAYPGGWDLQRDAFYGGMAAYGFALNPAVLVAKAPPFGVSHWLQMLRETIAGRIEAVLTGGQAAIAATLLTGTATAIPAADRTAFRNAGLAHLLAIAGLHIGIVMGLAFAATRLGLALWERSALHWPTKPIAAIAALLAGGGYMLLTGAHLPILRSFAMACLVTLGVSVGRRAVSLRGLALAMAALILFDPEAVVGVSFQMSFSAVLALIAGYAALRPWLTRLYGGGSWRRRLGQVGALALTSTLAGTASAPFAAYHFGHVQIYYILANLLAVPLTALWVMPAGLLALALMPLHLEALALVPMGWGVAGLLAIARFVAAWPAAVLAVPHIPGWGLAVLSLGIAWLGLWRSRPRLLGVLAIAAGLLSPLFDRPPDMLISADARLIALRTPQGVFVQRRPGASSFTLDEWLQFWAARDAAPLPLQGRLADGAITCTQADCVWRHGVVARLLREDESCDGAIVVSAEPIRLRCPPDVVRLDRFSVWRDGAQAIWLDPDGVRVLSDRDVRGARPWVAPVPTRNQVPAGLTPALAEKLPPE